MLSWIHNTTDRCLFATRSSFFCFFSFIKLKTRYLVEKSIFHIICIQFSALMSIMPFNLSMKIIAIFLGAIPTSCIYVALIAYLEGRQNTEIYISALNCVVVFGRSVFTHNILIRRLIVCTLAYTPNLVNHFVMWIVAHSLLCNANDD